MIEISNKIFDEERALYGLRDICVSNCRFDGPADGESAMKECRSVQVDHCCFNLRYPFWHVDNLKLSDSELTPLCRAALWYTHNVEITDTALHGVKALRECSDVHVADCDIVSSEFGWSVQRIRMDNTAVESEYFMLRAEQLVFRDVRLKGKYSFQYIRNGLFENCILDTKDAFWHAENVVIRNSVVKGEYLAWYSKNLTLENCRIIGTQPFCYCDNLVLHNCKMEETDFSFERSDVEAYVTTPILSVKNPRAGHIYAPAVTEIILDDPDALGEIIIL